MSALGNRRHSIIDGLEPDIKDTVDEMIRAGFTYREIVDYIRETGTETVSYTHLRAHET